MNNKVAVVTGGAQGIGKAVTLKLARERYSVIIADKDAEAGEEMTSGYGKIYDLHFLQTDVSEEESVKHLFRYVQENFSRLDALVNNAGIAQHVNESIEKLKLKDWDAKIRTNLTSSFLCVKYGAQLLTTSKGNVVNIASTRALSSEPDTEAYSASKGGIVALTHALANSLGPEVRVNAVSPGWIETRDWQKTSERKEPQLREIDHTQHPAGRVGRPEDVAHLVAFLLSNRAGFITGQNIVIDGGMTRKMIYEE